MSTRLAILGILRNGPLHGYELKHILEDHMGDWTNIAFGSIYFALGKLREEGMIAETEVYRAGGRPSRTVYAITDTGRAEFLRLLRESLKTMERQYFDVDLALGFMKALPVKEVRGYFTARAASLEEQLVHIEDHREAALKESGVPREASLIFSHSITHLRAELAWTREVLDALGQ